MFKATWLNDRDQFLYPNNKWQQDKEFQSDCLAYTLFHGQNRISSKENIINHWIPFTEREVDAKDKFESNFMTDFMRGKLKLDETETIEQENLLKNKENKKAKNTELNTPLEFSEEAKAVFDGGRELWRYYHSKPDININASFYDIREYFQGRDKQGKMNSKSQDEKYTELLDNLRDKLKFLEEKIQPKVYEYEFLRE